MLHNLKALGITVMAILAMSAVAASVASAQAHNGRITSTGNFTLTVTEIAGKVNALTFAGMTIECPGSTYDGHKYNVTPHTFIPNGEETFTITPTYKQPCKSTVGPMTIDMNECDYVLHILETNGVDTYNTTWTIVCPPGRDITFTTWFSEAEHKEGKESCTVHIAPQDAIGGTITDTTEGDLVLGGPIKVNVVQTKDGLHSLLCPAKVGALEIDLNLTVKAHNEALANTAISLSHL